MKQIPCDATAVAGASHELPKARLIAISGEIAGGHNQ